MRRPPIWSMIDRIRVFTVWMPSWLVSGRRMKMVSYSLCVPGSSRIDRAMFVFLLSGLPLIALGARSFVGIYLVHSRDGAFHHDQLHRVCRSTDQERYFFRLFLTKAPEHMPGDLVFSTARLADSTAHSDVRLADL